MYKKVFSFLFIFLFLCSFAILTRNIWGGVFSQSRVTEAFRQSRADLKDLEIVNGEIREKLQNVTNGIANVKDGIGRNGEIIENSRGAIEELESLFDDCRKRIRRIQEK